MTHVEAIAVLDSDSAQEITVTVRNTLNRRTAEDGPYSAPAVMMRRSSLNLLVINSNVQLSTSDMVMHTNTQLANTNLKFSSLRVINWDRCQ